MSNNPIICVNEYGGVYENGSAFSKAKWVFIIIMYERIVREDGSCTVRRLARSCGISRQSSHKAIDYYKIGIIVPPIRQQGHGRTGVGSLYGLKMVHHAYIYELYVKNAVLPLHGYIEEIHNKFGILLHYSLIERWFMTIGPFKGVMRLTSRFPSGRETWVTYRLLKKYLQFIVSVTDHRRLVFADEKPMKEIDIFDRVRRDPFTGIVPYYLMDANSKNRYNILCAVNVKGGHVNPVEFVILEECTNSSLFFEFVMFLLERGVLCWGDIFIVDNCSIHMKGDNIDLQKALFEEHGVLMMALPPYHPDYNPTELVFQTLLSRLCSERARYNSINADNFKDAINIEMADFNLPDVISFYQHCGYLK